MTRVAQHPDTAAARLSILGEVLASLGGVVSVEELADSLASGAKWSIDVDSLVLAVGPGLDADPRPSSGEWLLRSLLPDGPGWVAASPAVCERLARATGAASVRAVTTVEADEWPLEEPTPGLVLAYPQHRAAVLLGIRRPEVAIGVEAGYAWLLHPALAQALHRVELIEELRTTNEALRTAGVELAQRFRSAGQLAAGAAHELNTPLTTVLGILGSLRRELGPAEALGDGVVGEYLDLMESEVIRCQRLTRALLDFGAAGGGEAGPCDLNSVAREARALSMSSAPEQAARLQLELADHVIGTAPRAQVLQVVRNLVRNALEATEATGTVRLITGVDDGQAWVRVVDDGVGMAEDVLQQAFDPFFSRKPSGQGLGLAVCQRLISAMNGTLRAHSDGQGEGATFEIRIPVTGHPQMAAGQARTD